MSKTVHSAHIKEHPLASHNPYSSDEQYELLKKDIDGNGVLVPVVFYRGLLVDGRHRVKACLELFRGGDSDGEVPFVDLPHKYSLDKVRDHVLGLETRRHQTKTQIVTGQWLEVIFTRGETLRRASEVTGTSKDSFSKLNKIHEHFGINTIKALRRGEKVTVTDSMRKLHTDSIGKISKFINTIGEMGENLSEIKSKYEEKIRLRRVEAKEYLEHQDAYGIEAMRRELASINHKK